MARLWMGLFLLAFLLPPRQAVAERMAHGRIDQAIAAYQVNPDLTFTAVDTRDVTLHTDLALRRLDRSSRTFYPEKQTLEVVEAWVDQPDGSRVAVAAGSIFTRPSAASQSAPGFVNSLTTTVLFPQLRPGSRTHIVWRFTQKTPAMFGFNANAINDFSWDTRLAETRITLPASIPLHWRARGGFTVEDTVTDGVRHVVARIENTQGRDEEPAMVSTADFMPLFLATTLPDLETVGAIVHRASEDRAAVTPEIAELAALIAGDRAGLDAARAIHAWVAANIRYVAVYLSPDDGWVPHAASEVLKAGYGDCKDYVVLMRALLAARGIEAEMAAVDWGTRYTALPLWLPYFNHAILWLPAYDRYLNPTDRNAGFDALDRRLSGKPVVIMTREGRTAWTPVATPRANRYRYTASLTLTEAQAMEGTARFTMTPNMEIPARAMLSEATSLTLLAERILAATPEGGFGRFTTSDPRDLLRPLTLSATWHSPMAVNAQDHEIFLRVPAGPDIHAPARQRAKLSPTGTRQTPMVADISDIGWETTIAFPPGLSVARLPPDIDLTTPAGRYTARYRAENGVIHVWRDLVIEREVIAPADYPGLDRLINAPLVDARAVIVLTPAVR